MKKSILLFVLAAGTIMLISSCGTDDTLAPDVNVIGGDETISLNSVYTDLGATATDAEDGAVTVTSDLSASNPNVNLKGVYTITYSATDKAGNEGTATRTVTVVNDADFLGGQYIDAKDSCATPPVNIFDATVTASTTKNNEFTINNFGSFGTGVNVLCKLDVNGTDITATVPQSLGGSASLTTVYAVGSKVWSTSPLVFTISYNWDDGTNSDNCISTYIK